MNNSALAITKLQQGSTLMEVLIALLVFSIGLQGIASLQYQAVKQNFDSEQRSQGVWSAQELINRIRANTTGRADGNYTFNGDPCANIPNPSCADTDGNDVTACSPANMASFDIWESICVTPNQAHNQNQGRLINQNLIISCAGGCSTTSEIDLTLQWQSKAVTDDAQNISDDDDSIKTQQFRQVFRP